ncbi:MAG: Gfo/Idh/MocA family oxidoreductase [Clostridiales bacterium]|jgi:predicted dehydrogenase|nr:Gfo/Idh/MocA family oxidoreductase [Clostridiales bacterium]
MEKFGWCFIGCGSITRRVLRDLPNTQSGSFPAAVYSRNFERARQFAQISGARAYRTAEEAMSDPEVKAVYVATPNSSHKEYTMLALERGLPVLCEKPLALTRGEAEEMIDMAVKKGVYLSEAMWTGHNPVIQWARSRIDDGRIGLVRSLYASFSFYHPFDMESRLYDPALGGGALLDLGVYTVALTQMVYGFHPAIIDVMSAAAPTGVDKMCAVNFRYRTGGISRMFFGFTSTEPQDAIIGGEKGHIVIPHFWAPKSAALVRERPDEPRSTEAYQMDFPGEGYQFEFDAVVDDILRGRKQNSTISHKFSLAVMGLLDEIREEMSTSKGSLDPLML